jgi:UDP-N-acetylmuramate dehydrogenase
MINQLQTHQELQAYNTFNLKARSEYFIAYSSLEHLKYAIKSIDYQRLDKFVLGGGSNILLASDFDGLMLQPKIMGIEVLKEDDQKVWLKVGAGEVWDDFVAWCVNQGYYGIENLSYIPGNVGASPIQNIGAYGMEVMDVIEEVQGVSLENFEAATFDSSACKFSYRNSIFKQELKGKFIVHFVTFRLKKKAELILNYGNVAEELKKYSERSLRTLRKVIIDIRKSKLPEPDELPNAGSFFKNPVVNMDVLDRIKNSYPDVPVYSVSASRSKLAAGWLIDQCGWKGRGVGKAVVHKKQALVIINNGVASGLELLTLAEKVIASVKEKFGVNLEMEVNVVPSSYQL